MPHPRPHPPELAGAAADDLAAWWVRITLAPDSTVRDALYDRIALTDDDIALISTAPFQRLDRIQQLGFVSRIWPGAKHTRFEHSLGVMHLARLAAMHLARHPAGRGITREHIRTVTAAALLHDIGHYPFSHAIEELGPPVRNHEAVGRHLIGASPIADVLVERGLDPDRVGAMITGESLDPGDRLLRQILSGTLDVDKLDYLPRDARACHVPYGGVDTARLLDALTIAEVRVPGGATETRVVVGPKGISPLHSLINARQEMFDNVYWHHTNRTCMVMLLRAVQDAISAGAVAPEVLWTMDDTSLLDHLQRDAMPPGTRRLAGALDERRFHKRAVEVSARATELYGRLGNLWFDPAARRTVERQLAAALSRRLDAPVDDTAILIDIPKPERWKTDVWVVHDTPPIGMAPQMHWREVAGMGDDELKRYEEHRRLIRIVTAPEHRDLVAAEWESLLMPLLGGVF